MGKFSRGRSGITSGVNGLLLIDKPTSLTSRSVLNRIQKWFPIGIKLGHTGTLDPMATGVMVICVGSATRLAQYIQSMSKTYVSRFQLGLVSSTDDIQGDITPQYCHSLPTYADIQSTLITLVGNISQIPPRFSAVKVSGRRAYALSRKGEQVDLLPRDVLIESIQIIKYTWPFLDVVITCGKGTYVRSIARDLGRKLGCGGVVYSLRRSRVGTFSENDCVQFDPTSPKIQLIPMLAAVEHLPHIELDSENERKYLCGQPIGCQLHILSKFEESTELALIGHDRELVGVGITKQGAIVPRIVLNSRLSVD